MNVLLKGATEKFRATKVKVFSYGAASQFKSKYLFANMFHLQQKFDVSMNGVELFCHQFRQRCVKRIVWSSVKAGKVEGRNAAEFFNEACSSNKTVNVLSHKRTLLQSIRNWIKSGKVRPTLPETIGIRYVRPE